MNIKYLQINSLNTIRHQTYLTSLTFYNTWVMSMVKKAIRDKVGLVKKVIRGHVGMVKMVITGHVGMVKKVIIGQVGMVKKAIRGHAGMVKKAITCHVGMVKKAIIQVMLAWLRRSCRKVGNHILHYSVLLLVVLIVECSHFVTTHELMCSVTCDSSDSFRLRISNS